MNVCKIEDIKKLLEKRLKNTVEELDAWRRVERVKTKKGEDFAILSKNFNNCYFSDLFHDNEHPIVKIYVGYQESTIDIYGYLDELPENDERKKDYIKSFIRQKYKYNTDEIENAIKDKIEHLKNREKSFKNQLKNVDKCVKKINKKINELKEILKSEDLKEGYYQNTLGYALIDFIKNSII